MGEKEMQNYADVLNVFRPRFIRGYPSALYFYAKWVEENDVSVPSPDIVFSTAEKLFPHMREPIGRIFECEVFDAYGLNDGGISAYECPEHSGLHIDTERSVMEIVDHNGHQVDDGQGSILATSLYNFAMPFIRYSTGDAGQILTDKCGCGRETLLLREILGREYEMLLTPEGQGVFGGFFTTQIFDNTPSVREFQVVQKEVDRLIIRIVPEEGFDEQILDYIRTKTLSKSEKWNIEFEFVESIDRSRAWKYKFIINELVK
jgi:phenylacetate-CoA ligase